MATYRRRTRARPGREEIPGAPTSRSSDVARPASLDTAGALALQRTVGNRAVTSVLAPLAVQRVRKGAKKRSPGALKYTNKPASMKLPTTHVDRFVQHSRHVIPHSDLQAWLSKAKEKGGPGTLAGQMRAVIGQVLVAFGEQSAAQEWTDACGRYEASGSNQSLLQREGAAVRTVWGLIEWHPTNVFPGNGQVNSALQNRFDGGDPGKADKLYDTWKAGNTLLGLNPSALGPVTVPAIRFELDSRGKPSQVPDDFTVVAASHDGSRPLLPIRGARNRRA